MITAKNTGKREFLLSELKLNAIGLPYFLALTLSVLLYIWLWSLDSLIWGVNSFFSFICIPVVLTGLFLSEFFYRLTLALFGKFPMSKFWYGFNLSKLMKCGDREIPAGITAYRIALLVPSVILGLFPLVLGLSINDSTVYIFGMIFVLASVGDISLLWESRYLDSKSDVSEHPTRDGILVVNDNP